MEVLQGVVAESRHIDWYVVAVTGGKQPDSAETVQDICVTFGIDL